MNGARPRFLTFFELGTDPARRLLTWDTLATMSSGVCPNSTYAKKTVSVPKYIQGERLRLASGAAPTLIGLSRRRKTVRVERR